MKNAMPGSEFHKDSTADDVTAGIDLSGKVVFVTGCTTGIGLETMRVLADRGATVIGSSRHLARAEFACHSIAGQAIPVQLDLGDFSSVADCADFVRSLGLALDILICNAGYFGGQGECQLVEGVEKHFAVNHLGHFILVNRLLDCLSAAEQGRIVVVASRSAYTNSPESGILFEDLAYTENYSDMLAYGHSKLANVLFSLHLSELLAETCITSNALHPGLVGTEISRHLGVLKGILFRLVVALKGKTIAAGAATTCFVAGDERLASASGGYFEDCNVYTPVGDHHMHDRAMADHLFKISAGLTQDFLIDHESADLQHMNRDNLV